MIMYALFDFMHMCVLGFPISITEEGVEWQNDQHLLETAMSVVCFKRYFIHMSFSWKEKFYVVFFFFCRSPGPEAGGAAAGAWELLRRWQYLRWYRGQRGQLETQHSRPQCCLRYKYTYSISPPTPLSHTTTSSHMFSLIETISSVSIFDSIVRFVS